MMYKAPRGTVDILPDKTIKWQMLEQLIRTICANYNVKEIRTPIFEHTELFNRAVGDTTDVVSKEMYTFNDKKGRSITLRPEGTAGVARAYVENRCHGPRTGTCTDRCPPASRRRPSDPCRSTIWGTVSKPK